MSLIWNSAAGVKNKIIFVFIKTGNASCIPTQIAENLKDKLNIIYIKFVETTNALLEWGLNVWLFLLTTRDIDNRIVIDNLVPARDFLVNIFPSEGHNNVKSKDNFPKINN